MNIVVGVDRRVGHEFERVFLAAQIGQERLLKGVGIGQDPNGLTQIDQLSRAQQDLDGAR